MPLDKNLRVTYIKDPNNSERVLTIVRCLNEDGTVSFGISVNKPTTWIPRHESRNVKILVRIPGDQFSKKKGREIAVARLNGRGCVTLPIAEGVSPYMTVLTHLFNSKEDEVISRIAKSEIIYLSFLDELEQADSLLFGLDDDEDEDHSLEN